jgi:hypothetical protein
VNLTRTLAFFDARHVIVCGLDRQQLAIDDEWNVKLVDIDSIVEYTPRDGLLGQGRQCRNNGDCSKVDVVMYDEVALNEVSRTAQCRLPVGIS